jgi:serine protease Do
MKRFTVPSIVAAVVVLALGATSAVSQAFGQNRAERDRVRVAVPAPGPGTEIGLSIRDVETNRDAQGVFVEEVRPDGPAEKAGIKPSDIIVEFDGEQVRGVRQFSRLVLETVPGRSVKATVVRDGKKRDVQITPSQGRPGNVMFNRDAVHERLDGLVDRLPPFDFDLSLDPARSPRGRLGATVQDMPKPLADYFGSTGGVLVSEVAGDSAASRAGLMPGDVITSVNSVAVRSRADLVQQLAVAGDNREVTIGIVRNKKESTLKATIEPIRRPSRSARRI